MVRISFLPALALLDPFLGASRCVCLLLHKNLFSGESRLKPNQLLQSRQDPIRNPGSRIQAQMVVVDLPDLAQAVTTHLVYHQDLLQSDYFNLEGKEVHSFLLRATGPGHKYLPVDKIPALLIQHIE